MRRVSGLSEVRGSEEEREDVALTNKSLEFPPKTHTKMLFLSKCDETIITFNYKLMTSCNSSDFLNKREMHSED